MATTALQALPYPVGSDTPAGMTQILALANAVEKKAVMVFASDAARTSAFTAAGVTATEGMLSWLQDTNAYYYHTGAAWRPLTELGGGTGSELGYAEITANTSEITTTADVTGLSISFTLAVTRKVLIKASVNFSSTTAADIGQALITDAANTQIADSGRHSVVTASQNYRSEFSCRKSLPAAAYTYKVRATFPTTVGTTVIAGAAANPSYIQALDIGP